MTMPTISNYLHRVSVALESIEGSSLEMRISVILATAHQEQNIWMVGGVTEDLHLILCHFIGGQLRSGTTGRMIIDFSK